jgi:ATP-dependent Clp protease ATP-binding subunit ClpA
MHTIYGRDKEIDLIIEALCSKDSPNSVMLIGEAGVGKTALVEYLAQLLEFNSERFPKELRDCQILSLQLNSLVAGTMYRGMFEERMESLLNELKQRPYLILFIDQAHTLVGAGTAIGSPTDAANIFKSVLSYGEIKIIAATTPAEFKRFIMEDEAFARRFNVIKIEEPTLEQTRIILNGLISKFNQNYSVVISQDALEMIMELAPRYDRHIRLPDKAIKWLDRACVKTYLRKGDNVVKAEDIYNVISECTKIPIELISRVVNQKMQNLEIELRKRVVGQEEAINKVSKRIRMNKGPLKENYYRPDGIFLFLGPTGVGKTELAKALAEYLFGNENKMIRVDMSEYQSSQVSIEKLIGMPRGFSGSEYGGLLTNIVLLDEIEKASSEIFHLFLQVFDEGWLRDGYGRKVYFSDSIIIMTSNLGSSHFRKILNPLGFYNESSSINLISKAINQEIEKTFLPEFINRIDDVIIFKPLSWDEVREIANKYITHIRNKLAYYGKKMEITDEALNKIVEEGYSYMYGARFLKRKIDERVRIPITEEWERGSEYILMVEGNDYKLVVK